MSSEEVWVLRLGDQDVGRLHFTGVDQPFYEYRFEPNTGFNALRPLFEAELKLLNADDMTAWEPAYQRILDSGLRIEREDGSQQIMEYVLHIDGKHAWMRHLPPGETF